VEAVVRIYKLSQNLETEESEYELIQDELVLNDSFPLKPWHSQTTLTQKGVLLFQTQKEGAPDEYGMTGHSIQLLILDFESRSVKTLLQFKIKIKDCRGVYLLKSISGRIN
jgi:hypothetical protein